MKKITTDKQTDNSDGRALRLANLKPFKKGQSGNPKGRPKSLTLSEAYRRELAKIDPADPQQRTFAEMLAERTVSKAKGGDVAALKELTDRAEGKAKQTIAFTLNRREQLERAINNLIESEAAVGRELARADAVQALSLFMPEVSQLVN